MTLQIFCARFSEMEVLGRELNYMSFITSQTHVSAVFLISVTNREQIARHLGYQMKNEAADLSRIGLNLI